MLAEFIRGVLSAYGAFLVTFSLCLVAELFWPRGKMSVRDRAHGLMFWAVHLPITTVIVMSFSAFREAVGVSPILEGAIPISSPIVAPIIGGVWSSFFFYWFHRAQHRFLWRFHSVHHSIRHLSGINSYHHWTERFFYGVVAGIPMSLFSLETLASSAWVVTLMTAWPYLIHSPTRLDMGPLKRVVIGPSFHRIHHSLERKHWDKNFGGFITLWDWLFGTAYWPERDEWPEVGLANRPEPRTLTEWAMAPWSTSVDIDGPARDVAAAAVVDADRVNV